MKRNGEALPFLQFTYLFCRRQLFSYIITSSVLQMYIARCAMYFHTALLFPINYTISSFKLNTHNPVFMLPHLVNVNKTLIFRNYHKLKATQITKPTDSIVLGHYHNFCTLIKMPKQQHRNVVRVVGAGLHTYTLNFWNF